MTNYEWLNSNKLYDTFIKDYNSLLWFKFIEKYGIDYNPKCDLGEAEIILHWLNSNHSEVHRYVDMDKVLEYLRKNDTSIDCDYIRINRDKFRTFLNTQINVKYITE